MKNIFIIIIIICSFSCENKINPTGKRSENKIDTLFYQYKGFNNGMKLYLFNDNKFKYEFYSYGCTGGGENEFVTGNYTMSENKIHLKPDSVKIKILDFQSPTEFKNYNLKYQNDSLKIKTEYDIINWNNIQYLISPQKNKDFRRHTPIFMVEYDIDSILLKRNDYYEFADYYNLGYEPKKHGRYLTQITKNTDSIFEKLKINRLPKKWKHLFLENPIAAKVLKIVKEKKTYHYNENEKEEYYINVLTLDKRSNDNVRIGMEFYDKKKKKYIKITSVSKNESNGVTYETLRKSELVKTNWE